MKAYGACAYIVSENESSLVMARNRVAPLRQMTIPKLKLMAAVIGARLCDHVMSNLRCARAYLWSDSQIVLRWLSSEKTNSIFVNNRAKESSALVQLHSSLTHSQGHVLLKTAITPISSGQTSLHANLLLDEGAQRSFITTDLANKLELVPTGKEALSISGFGDTSNNMRELPTAIVYLQTETETIPMNVLIVPEIAVPLRTYPNNMENMKHLTGLKLAHPAMNDGYFEIMVLIGADYYWSIVQDRVIRGNGPTAVESKIGYLLSGPTTGCNKKLPPTLMMNIMTSHSAEEVDLERFWKVESDQTHDSYMAVYQSASITFQDGKYFAKLPWKHNHPVLPTNKEIAERRTQQVILCLKRDPDLLQVYDNIINEQEKRGFVEKVPECDQPKSMIHYIPHHPVRKESATTPIRIVYDCSCKSSSDSPSLNDCLMSTPPKLNDITSLFLRFRRAWNHLEIHSEQSTLVRRLVGEVDRTNENLLEKGAWESVCEPYRTTDCCYRGRVHPE